MTALLFDVEGRPESPFYRQVSVARGERLIHLAGQVGSDETGQLVPGGLAAQAEQAMLNVGLALEAAGATEDDLVKLTVHGAATLFEPGMLVEIEAVAVAA